MNRNATTFNQFWNSLIEKTYRRDEQYRQEFFDIAKGQWLNKWCSKLEQIGSDDYADGKRRFLSGQYRRKTWTKW